MCSIHGSARRCGRFRRWAGRTRPRICATYYPTSLLISGYDILFFWDARMIMMGLHCDWCGRSGANSLPAAVFAFAGAHGGRREDVEDQGHGRRSAGTDAEIRDRRDALHAGEHGRAGHGHRADRRPDSERARVREQDLECGAIFVYESGEGGSAAGLRWRNWLRRKCRARRSLCGARAKARWWTAGFFRGWRRLREKQQGAGRISFSRSVRTRSITFSGAISAIGTSSG